MRKTMNYRRFGWTIGILTAAFLLLFWIEAKNLQGRRKRSLALR